MPGLGLQPGLGGLGAAAGLGAGAGEGFGAAGGCEDFGAAAAEDALPDVAAADDARAEDAGVPEGLGDAEDADLLEPEGEPDEPPDLLDADNFAEVITTVDIPDDARADWDDLKAVHVSSK